MSDSNSSVLTGGISLCGAVFIVFLVMRLTDHIDWAWYWVAAPLWMPSALCLGIVGAIFALAGVVYGIGRFIELVGGKSKKELR